MARMLLAAEPPHGPRCRYARRGCRCYLHPEARGRRATTARRRANRATENHTWRADADREAS